MKAQLLIPPWGETGRVRPESGRPHLDLLLATLGWEELACQEAQPGFALTGESGPGLILAQDNLDGAVGRILLAALREARNSFQPGGLTLLRGATGAPLGFTVTRPGVLAVCCQNSLWNDREAWWSVVEAHSAGLAGAGPPAPRCWLVEGEVEASTRRWLEGVLFPEPCRLRPLPDGDFALLLPADREEAFYAGLRRKLGHWLYAETPRPLEEVAGERLQGRQWRAVLAESCTAGLAAARLGGVAGSSAHLEGGFVTYSNACKQAQLGVAAELLERKGAVSAEVAEAMARGALAATGAEVAVAITGIAGPGGGSPTKPVGTVFLCGATKGGQLVPRQVRFAGGREQVRYRSSQAALHIVRRLAEDT